MRPVSSSQYPVVLAVIWIANGSVGVGDGDGDVFVTGGGGGGIIQALGGHR